MRRWILRAARLYPRDWRARYGEEFEALVDEATADWRQLLNVSRTALTMQFSRRVGALKTIAALSLAGGLLALAASYSVPPRYVSSATFRITPVIEGARPAQADFLERETDDRFIWLKMYLTGRDNLLAILRDPSLDLYAEEQQQLPLEDLAERMKDDGSIQIDRQGAAVHISFAYRDREKAQAVVRMLERELQEQNDVVNRETAANWKRLWSTPIPFSERIELAEPPDLPAAPVESLRSIFVAAGIAGSLLLGALLLFVRRRPKLALRMAVCGLLGAIAGAGVSLLISERYTSKATMRLTAPLNPAQYSGLAPTVSLAQWLPVLQKQILNPENLTRILTRPGIAADRSGFLGMRMKDRDILEITVTYSDPFKARAIAVEMIAELQAKYGATRMEFDKHLEEQVRIAYLNRAAEKLELVLQPSSDGVLTTHYRLLYTFAGATLGILFAAVRYRTSMNGESSLSL
jgi:hypothetical protein